MGSVAISKTQPAEATLAAPLHRIRSLDHAMQRAALAATQPEVLRIAVATALDAVVASFTGIAFLVYGVLLGGGLLFAGFVGIHAASAARGNALYGPLGPPLEPPILPTHLRAPGVRCAYEAVLRAHARVRAAIRAGGDTRGLMLSLYGRCRDLVLLAGRVAAVANTVSAYLEEHDDDPLQAEVRRLHASAGQAGDPRARRAFEQTADARLQQQRGVEEFRALLDRIQARVELIAASLELVHAFAIKLQARLLEQAAFAGGYGDGLDLLRQDLEMLEAAMDEALGAPDDDISIVADVTDCVASLDHAGGDASDPSMFRAPDR